MTQVSGPRIRVRAPGATGARRGGVLATLAGLAAGLLLVGPGTVAEAQRVDGSDSPLMSWLTRDLEPALSQRFAQHPRLRGQAVQVLAMRGTQARVRSDALTQAIVRHLSKALASQSGTRVVPVDGYPSAEACMAQASVEYRVGVDLRAAGSSGVQVDVRVFDVAEGAWVGGFGDSWSGALERAEREALAREIVSEGARGARELPFEVGQADLVAKSLAAQIDCVLAGARQREPRGAALYLQPAGEIDAHLQKAGLLLMHALRAGHGWHQVMEREEADLVLELHTQVLGGDLSVFWVSLNRPRSTAQGTSREGVVASASTYVNGKVSATPVRVVRGEPAPATAAPVPAPPSVATASADPLVAGPLLSSPRMLTQRSAQACADAVGGAGRRRDASPCALVEVTVARPATVFWLWQPASCRLQGNAGTSAPRVVSRRTEGVATLTARLHSATDDAYDSLYVIAVEPGDDARAVQSVLERHPGGRNCDAPQWDRELRRWALALESTLLRLGEAADWQAVRAPRRATRMASSELSP